MTATIHMPTPEERARRQEIAKTILAQLGGRQFIAMTGANTMSALADGLSMRISSRLAKKRIAHVEIRLNGKDLYDVKAHAFRGVSGKLVSQETDIPVENLRSTFTQITGLETRL